MQIRTTARRGRALLLTLAIAMIAAPVPPVVAGPRLSQAQSGSSGKDADSSDIIVNGKRYSRHLPKDLAIVPDLARGRARLAARAGTLVKCMRFLDPDLLRKAIDGPLHYSTSRFALGRLIQENLGCYPNYNPVPPRTADDFGSCNAATVQGNVGQQFGTTRECQAPYERAALIRRVIGMYAPDLSLSAQETTEPAVQARFDAREIERNRLRRGDDKLLFEIAVCMVRMRPEASVRLTLSQSTGEQYALEEAILDGAKPCIGGMKSLGIDPVEFRDYITDSVYRWAVAARNVDSLIPASN